MKALSTLGTTMLALFALTAAGCGANTGEPTTETTAETTSALSSPDEHSVPFVGLLWGADVNNAAGTGATETASGFATELGRYTYSATFVFNADGSADGTGVWTAENGDTLDSAAHAVPGAQNGAILSLLESHTVTGGSGRFRDARGSFEVHCKLNVNTNDVHATIDGKITH